LGTKGANSESIILDHHDDDCFGSIEASFKTLDEKSVEVTFTPKDMKDTNGKCKDTFVVASTTNLHTMVLSEAKPHVMTFKNLKPA